MSEKGEAVRHTGGCLCGALRFEIKGPLSDAVACHCTMCRKQTGHFWASTHVAKEDLVFIADKGLKWYRSSGDIRRGFCSGCGSVLFFDRDGASRISISGGAIDGKTAIATRAHIYCADKGDYYEIGDGLPQFPSIDR